MTNLISKIFGFFFSDEGKITALVGANVGAGTAQATVSVVEPILRIVLLLVQITIGVFTAIYVWKKMRAKKRGNDLLLIGGISVALAVSGCAPLSQKGGKSSFFTPGGISGSVQQSENPKSDTEQVLERITETLTPNGVTVRTTEKLATKIGAAQKDTAREMTAKLSSLKGVVWVGILLFVFGAASLVWPPLKTIVGSTTTSLIAAASGIALIALPSFIVGHELLIMGVGLAGVLAYWFAHRHGELRGEVKHLKR